MKPRINHYVNSSIVLNILKRNDYQPTTQPNTPSREALIAEECIVQVWMAQGTATRSKDRTKNETVMCSVHGRSKSRNWGKWSWRHKTGPFKALTPESSVEGTWQTEGSCGSLFRRTLWASYDLRNWGSRYWRTVCAPYGLELSLKNFFLFCFFFECSKLKTKSDTFLNDLDTAESRLYKLL